MFTKILHKFLDSSQEEVEDASEETAVAFEDEDSEAVSDSEEDSDQQDTTEESMNLNSSDSVADSSAESDSEEGSLPPDSDSKPTSSSTSRMFEGQKIEELEIPIGVAFGGDTNAGGLDSDEECDLSPGEEEEEPELKVFTCTKFRMFSSKSSSQ